MRSRTTTGQPPGWIRLPGSGRWLRAASRNHRGARLRAAHGAAASFLAAGLLMVLPACSVGAPGDPSPRYAGVQLHALWSTVSRAQMYADIRTARSLAVSAVRIDVGWSSAQSAPGRYQRWYVRKLNAFMRRAARSHIKVIATLMTTPCWASSAPRSLRQGCRGDWWNRGVEWYPPRHAEAYGRFVRWFTSRYGRDLAAVEIWNEPDAVDHPYWHSADPARSYARLLSAGYAGAKRADPAVPVIAGSLAGADIPFLRALYRDGIRGHYDGIALHPYCQPSSPTARAKGRNDRRWSFLGGIRAVRRAQRRAGDSSPLWLTEFGWASGSGYSEVSPARQARYTAEALRLSRRMPYVSATIVYALHDDGTDPLDWQDNLGLLNPDNRPKPVFFAVRAAFEQSQSSP